MPDYGQCDLCKKGNLKFLGKKVVANTDYDIVKCDQCGHEIAKRVE
ncbi:MAG: hypothetical protein ABIJ08_01995 [Nanoarchaeota archaeon]